MYPDTQSEVDALVLLQTGLQGCHRSEDTQTRAYGSMRVIVVRLGIAKIDEETIAQELGNMSVKTLDDCRTGGVIRTDHVAVVFGIELAGESGGVHYVTEHHGELAAFRLGRSRGGWRRGRHGCG